MDQSLNGGESRTGMVDVSKAGTRAVGAEFVLELVVIGVGIEIPSEASNTTVFNEGNVDAVAGVDMSAVESFKQKLANVSFAVFTAESNVVGDIDEENDLKHIFLGKL